jgi:hypothetical protein
MAMLLALQRWISAGTSLLVSKRIMNALLLGRRVKNFGVVVYVLLREGEAVRDVVVLASVVNPNTVSNCCFCTDDLHVDSLIRKGYHCSLHPRCGRS